MDEAQKQNLMLRGDLKTSASVEIVDKLEKLRKREDYLENQVRELKRQIEKMKIKYESNF